VTENDTIVNNMMTEDSIRDIAARAIAQTLQSIDTHTEEAMINDNNQSNNAINGPPVASINDFDWHYHDLPLEINNPVGVKEWACLTTSGHEWITNCNRTEHISRLDVFLQMFPPKQLVLIVAETNKQLHKNNKKETTCSEILKLFGIFILMTKYEFSNRGNLWNKEPAEEFEAMPNLHKSGMAKKIFEDLFSNIRFSKQPDQ
jgi:Transposase IS4